MRDIHPSFYQTLPALLVPFALFLLLPLGAKPFYVLLFFIWLQLSFFLFIRLFISTTHYLVWPDRIEKKTGVFSVQSRSIPFDEITEIYSRKSLFQRLFGIGDIFIDTAGGREFTVVLGGVRHPDEVAQSLFALKKRGAA